MSYIHHNILVNNYRSVWPIDHYEDSYNFQIYGSKKNLMGHSKMDHHEIYVYPNLCILSFGSGRSSDAYNESWVNNICVLHKSSVPYKVECNTADLFVPYLANNTIYTDPGVNIGFECIVNGTSILLTLEQWQAISLDLGTTIQTAPDVQTIIEWGRKMLQGGT